ncbi:translation initiation factor IF-2 subunit alpha [Candidatus Bathyarchaeota archaeon]|nr:MAG: translation initiation factor IF-2 subunit alpha [Candidatus Bathyarchaeota archaeon]
MDGKHVDSMKEFPEVGELVVGTVTNVTDYGAYIALDEYGGIEGLLHISEISSSWVKNINDFVREGEKLVLKVLRVDKEKRHIDLSLRRVSKREKQEKMVEWKKKKKSESILEVVGQKLGLEPTQFTSQVMSILEEKFGTAYTGLEEFVERGEELADRLKIPREWARAIVEVAQQKIKPSRVKIKSILQLTTTDPNGIETIKKILVGCKSVKKPRKVKIDIYTVGAPKYMVEVTAKNYKDAEKVLQEIASYALKEIREAGGEGEFKR